MREQHYYRDNYEIEWVYHCNEAFVKLHILIYQHKPYWPDQIKQHTTSALTETANCTIIQLFPAPTTVLYVYLF